MDGLDKMIASLTVETDFTKEDRRSAEFSTSYKHGVSGTQSPAQGNKVQARVTEPGQVAEEEHYTEESEENIASVIQVYKNILNDLADPKINEKVNETLSRISYTTFVQYYQENASLSDYTMEKELDRLNFSVTYDGSTTDSKLKIKDIYWETRLDDMWRYANQSLYADLLMNLMSYFHDLFLNISVVIEDCNFELNLDTGEFKAMAIFDIILESNGSKVSVANVTGHILLHLEECTVEQRLETPCMNVIFDSQLREAAISLLASEDNDMDMLMEYNQPRRGIDTLVDAVTETAQALPEQISSMIPTMEGAVGFFGKLLGAEKESDRTSDLGDLSNTIRDKANLPVKSALSSDHVFNIPEPTEISIDNQNENQKMGADQNLRRRSNSTSSSIRDDEWDDWD